MNNLWSMVRAGVALALALVLSVWLLGDEITPLLLAIRNVVLFAMLAVVVITAWLMFRRP